MKKLFITIILLLVILSDKAQITTLNFVGHDRTGHDYVQLDRVSVFNQTQLWHEVLYYPDTTLRLGAVGIDDYVANGFQLLQNLPNPFDGVSDFALSLPSGQDVQLEIYDVNGKKVAAQVFPSLSAGTHLFRTTLSTPQTYLLSASTHEGKASIKMINTGDGGDNSIVYLGMANADHSFTIQLKEDRGTAPYPFSRGDRMQYTGYAVIDDTERVSEVIENYQNSDENIHLKFDVARPTVTTNFCSNIIATSATFNGAVTADNNALVTERGFCYKTGLGNTIITPTINDNVISSGNGLGFFSETISNLPLNTKCFVRAYARNSIGTSYGAITSFNTGMTSQSVDNVVFIPDANCDSACIHSSMLCSSFPPAAMISRATDILGIRLNIEHSSIGDINISIICPNGQSVRLLEDHNDINNNAHFGLTLDDYGTGCYAQNNPQGVGWNYCWSENSIYAQLSDYCYNYNNVGHDASGTVDSSQVAHGYPGQPGFVQGRQYYQPNQSFSNLIGCPLNGLWQIEVCDTWPGDNGYVFGWELTFDPSLMGVNSVSLPSVSTSSVSDITQNSATCGGNVMDEGSSAVTAHGVCWSTSQLPTIIDNHTTNGSGNGSFTSSITGLSELTTYYVRAYATNGEGTAYGEQQTFTTAVNPDIDVHPCPGTPTLTDVDGNTYNTVQIGNQCWMKENLRTTRYADNTPIALGNEASYDVAYRYYPNNSSNNVTTYGYLYNWSAVMRNSSSSSSNPSGIQGICPNGWHVPSDAEWTQLTNYVSSQSSYCCSGNTLYIAKALASQTGWSCSIGTCDVGNTPSSNNATGFSALPAGDYYGSYFNFGNGLAFWSATERSSNSTYYRYLNYNATHIGSSNFDKDRGISVRCLRD